MPERISCDKERPHNLEKKDNQNIYFTKETKNIESKKIPPQEVL